jgi:TRAP-type C4-dicarboxylate transport system permease small subunit
VTSPANFEPSTTERVLAAMIVGVIALSILAFFAIIVGTWQGMDSAAFSAGLWPAIPMTPLFGLPIGFVLIITLLVISTRRRRALGTDDASE